MPHTDRARHGRCPRARALLPGRGFRFGGSTPTDFLNPCFLHGAAIDPAHRGPRCLFFIAPGSVFCVDKTHPLAKGIRINVSRADDARFYDFLLRKLT
ncbi:hypothetical protein MPL1032_30171 [Mesorhizobium plurifarium]|uniref:Uncharacterized protein n=1 Tax=Mesorhizobium plurifarium TaxID=69974 RepID=A0A0K2W2Z4_MESPL|nr:hypothetical protein MPL1032_30171 [Mesorhizobium plurifarium]